ncbi:hypothetical protein [Pendulispora albinea]|uniref:Uncharacterized protein n=1 Tax=Pendulispora albinea TaxID=2741071 RepID=A0ABZ2M8C3_9BACT
MGAFFRNEIHHVMAPPCKVRNPPAPRPDECSAKHGESAHAAENQKQQQQQQKKKKKKKARRVGWSR